MDDETYEKARELRKEIRFIELKAIDLKQEIINIFDSYFYKSEAANPEFMFLLDEIKTKIDEIVFEKTKELKEKFNQI